MRCPACGQRDKTLFFCSSCWWKLPAKERQALERMHRLRLDSGAKIEKCVRILRPASELSVS